MHTLQPVTFLVGTNSLFSFHTTIIPHFFGSHCIRLTHKISEIGYMIPASNHFITSFFTTSSWLGWATFGVRPTSYYLLPKWFYACRKKGWCPWYWLLSFGPMEVYVKWFGSCLSSREGETSIDGCNFYKGHSKGSTSLELHCHSHKLKPKLFP